MKNYLKIGIIFLSIIFLQFRIIKPIHAKSGCCSHHDGVCGCRGGRQVCCDGTLSPSCTCYSPQPTKVPTRIIPTKIPTSTKTQPTPTKIISSSINTPTSITTNQAKVIDETSKTTKSESSSNPLPGLIILSLIGFGGYKLVKKNKKPKGAN